MLDSESLFTAVNKTAVMADRAAVGRGAGRGARRVLVAEDAPVARELLCGILRSFGLRVIEASDGREGIEKAREHTPDLIITDVEMPYVDGLEMVASIRNDVGLVHVPVLVLTTRTDEATRARARDVGARGFISKQRFVEEELRKLVDLCLDAA